MSKERTLRTKYQTWKDLNEFIDYLSIHLKVMQSDNHAGVKALLAVEGDMVDGLINELLHVDSYVSYFANNRHCGSGFYVDSCWESLYYSKTLEGARRDLRKIKKQFTGQDGTGVL